MFILSLPRHISIYDKVPRSYPLASRLFLEILYHLTPTLIFLESLLKPYLISVLWGLLLANVKLDCFFVPFGSLFLFYRYMNQIASQVYRLLCSQAFDRQVSTFYLHGSLIIINQFFNFALCLSSDCPLSVFNLFCFHTMISFPLSYYPSGNSLPDISVRGIWLHTMTIYPNLCSQSYELPRGIWKITRITG